MIAWILENRYDKERGNGAILRKDGRYVSLVQSSTVSSPSHRYSLPSQGTQKIWMELMIAMAPDEAAPIIADFAGKLNMEMSGKFWAPSTYLLFLLPFSPPPLLSLTNLVSRPFRTPYGLPFGRTLITDGARGIGNAEEVMGKEWASKPGPLELPW